MHRPHCTATNAIRVDGVKRTAGSSRAKDWFFALSLANLSMIHVWNVLLYASPVDRYYLPHYGAVDYGVALLLLLCGTLLVAALRATLKRTRRRSLGVLAQVLVVVALLAPLDALREALGVTRFELLQLWKNLPAAVQAAAALGGLTGAVCAWRARRHCVSAVFFAVLVLAPLAVGNAAQCAWRAITARDTPGDGFAAPAQGTAPGPRHDGPRVVWIVFDELDYGLAFADRPDGLALPELDRLRAESFFASAAEEASASTGKAIPSLLLGESLRAAKPLSPSALEIAFAPAGDPRRLSELPHFFSRVRERGLDLDLLGLYHPYCRLFAGDYRTCHWDPFLPGGGLARPSDAARIALNQLHKLIPLHHRGEHIASIRRTLALGNASRRMRASTWRTSICPFPTRPTCGIRRARASRGSASTPAAIPSKSPWRTGHSGASAARWRTRPSGSGPPCSSHRITVGASPRSTAARGTTACPFS